MITLTNQRLFMKNLLYFMSFCFPVLSCSKEEINSNDNNTATGENTITTWAHTFQPATLNCNLGDTVYFDLGGSHNAIEVSEASYEVNSATPIENGFEFGYGANSFFVPLEAKTYYYVCVPHLPEMKAKIIVE
jgi:plastocyanin